MGVPGCPEFACCTASMLRVLIVLIESKSLVGILTFWQMTRATRTGEQSNHRICGASGAHTR